jgi:hypothetical protein
MDPEDDSQPEEELIGLPEDGEEGVLPGSDSRVSAASDVLNRVTSSGTEVSIASCASRLAVGGWLC